MAPVKKTTTARTAATKKPAAAKSASPSFRAIVKASGKTATGIQVPAAVVEQLGTSKKPAVTATINGYTYRTSVASMGGVFMLPVSADVRERSGVAAGDTVDIRLELDTAPREVTVPPDFADALTRNAPAKRFFDSLSYSNRLRFVLSINGAKTDETRQRRIEKSIAMLRDGKV
jgi:hypothetical protein